MTNFMKSALFSAQGRRQGGDVDQISTCPHCHLALPVVTLRWHEVQPCPKNTVAFWVGSIPFHFGLQPWNWPKPWSPFLIIWSDEKEKLTIFFFSFQVKCQIHVNLKWETCSELLKEHSMVNWRSGWQVSDDVIYLSKVQVIFNRKSVFERQLSYFWWLDGLGNSKRLWLVTLVRILLSTRGQESYFMICCIIKQSGPRRCGKWPIYHA